MFFLPDLKLFISETKIHLACSHTSVNSWTSLGKNKFAQGLSCPKVKGLGGCFFKVLGNWN